MIRWYPPRVFADRNFATMSAVVAAISFGMLGLFLPLVIFLQSVLDLTALQAGLVLAPMSLASIASAPFAGRLADREGGKDTLITGLVLWAGGIGLVLWATRPYYDRRELITGLVIAGFGLGMTFAPLQSIAMRNVQPMMAGAAAGLINTTRQLGAVLGSAAVGALLQAQLVARLPQSARANVDALPQSLRGRFLEGFDKVTMGRGLEVGAGQTGAHLPPEIPESVRPAVEQVALKTFYEAYVPAMRTTLILPLARARRRRRGRADPHPLRSAVRSRAPTNRYLKIRRLNSAYWCGSAASSSAILARGRIWSASLAAITEPGMLNAIDVALSWASTVPPASLTARAPAVPS